jgi:hypothetical protein
LQDLNHSPIEKYPVVTNPEELLTWRRFLPIYVPIAREELASSPSSSETSIAKENKLLGESFSRGE